MFHTPDPHSHRSPRSAHAKTSHFQAAQQFGRIYAAHTSTIARAYIGHVALELLFAFAV